MSTDVSECCSWLQLLPAEATALTGGWRSTLPMKTVRRELEEALQLPAKALDAHKEFIGERVLQAESRAAAAGKWSA